MFVSGLRKFIGLSRGLKFVILSEGVKRNYGPKGKFFDIMFCKFRKSSRKGARKFYMSRGVRKNNCFTIGYA